ncbi:MAG: hypothetical protein ACI9HG_002235, partial [Flavobacteriales bacterium]
EYRSDYAPRIGKSERENCHQDKLDIDHKKQHY